MNFGPKEVDWACSFRKNKKRFRRHKLVHCMQPDTRLRTMSHTARKSRESIPNMSFGPKQVDWACSLRKNKKRFRRHKLLYWVHPDTHLHTMSHEATKSRETTPNMSLGPKEADWACSLWKNKKQFRRHKLVQSMHPHIRFRTMSHAATKSRGTTSNMSFGPKEVDWACSFRKNKK